MERKTELGMTECWHQRAGSLFTSLSSHGKSILCARDNGVNSGQSGRLRKSLVPSISIGISATQCGWSGPGSFPLTMSLHYYFFIFCPYNSPASFVSRLWQTPSRGRRLRLGLEDFHRPTAALSLPFLATICRFAGVSIGWCTEKNSASSSIET